MIVASLYPKRCPICDTVLAGKDICVDCKKKIRFIKEKYCLCCGKPLQAEEREFCFDCLREPKSFKRNFVLMVYDEITKLSMYRFKYNNRREYADFYSKEIIKRYGNQLLELDIDFVIPVPLHKKKKRKRGYNQAEVLAKKVAKELNIQLNTKILVRIKNTLPQKELNKKQRAKNLEKAFQICDNRDKIKRVVLVDDIYTTGVTMEACTKALLRAGIQEVYGICICSGLEE